MKILVVGDYIEDRYVFGTATRICPEAPVPVIVPQEEKRTAGGAGLVVAQLDALDCDIVMFYGSHSIKERYFAGNHLVCRVDRDRVYTTLDLHVPSDEHLAQVDAIVVSDYGKGALTEGLAKQLVAVGKPLFVDAKHHWEWYGCEDHVTFFPNEHEYVTIHAQHVARKLGAKGCQMGLLKIPATVSEVVDVTGAGDIFMAGFVWAWSLGCPAEDCLRLANTLAGESCRHRGTYVVPLAFAQAELDKIRASVVLPLRLPVHSPDSMRTEPGLWPPQDRASVSEVVSESDIPLGGCDPEPAARAADLCIPDSAQIPQRPPLDPTERIGVLAPLDQRIVGGVDRKWR